MNIGQAGQASGVSAKMIRYYEEIGSDPARGRTGSGYRSYGEKDVHRLRFIRRARDLGFTVEGIQELLGLWQDRDRHASDVKRLAVEQVGRLRQKIAGLQAMVATLETLRTAARGTTGPTTRSSGPRGGPAGPPRTARRSSAALRRRAAPAGARA
jgi:MerR family gold-responsive transcriptional activator of gol and ges genes